jgi:hypothetical protein
MDLAHAVIFLAQKMSTFPSARNICLVVLKIRQKEDSLNLERLKLNAEFLSYMNNFYPSLRNKLIRRILIAADTAISEPIHCTRADFPRKHGRVLRPWKVSQFSLDCKDLRLKLYLEEL